MGKRFIIALHGYGSCGDDFSRIFGHYGFPDDFDVICLDAPHKCELGFGRQWFHLDDEITIKNVKDGLNTSAPELLNTITSIAQSKAIDFKNIDIIGFSQGAMLAFSMVYYANFGHIIGYSGFFVPNNAMTPYHENKVLIVHSIDDDVVPYNNMALSFESFKGLDFCSIETYTMAQGTGHSISFDGYQKGLEFISS